MSASNTDRSDTFSAPTPEACPSSPDYPVVLQNATKCYAPATVAPHRTISAPSPESQDPTPEPPRNTLPAPRASAIPALRARFNALTPEQDTAIELLIVGRTDAEVAAQVGVHRVTVTRWRLYHILFQSELSRRRQEVFASAADRFRSALRRAVRTLTRQFSSEDPLVAFRAARAMLQLASRFVPPDDPADPHAIVEKHARTKRIEWKSIDPRTDEIDDDDRARALWELAWLNENYSYDPPATQPLPAPARGQTLDSTYVRAVGLCKDELPPDDGIHPTLILPT